jgi:protein gp37
VENQEVADYRLPLFLSFPIKRRYIACAPLLSSIDLSPYLSGIDHVTFGGETSREARTCDYDWVLDIREQCLAAGATFWFKNTGSRFKCNGEIQKVNAFKETSIAKELDISKLDGKRLF